MSLNKGSLDAILNKLRVKQLKQEEVGANMFSAGSNVHSAVAWDTAKQYLNSSGGGHTWTLDALGSFNNTNFFLANHDATQYFENYLKALFSLVLEINDFYFPKDVVDAGSNLLIGWHYTIDSGLTWVEVEENEYSGLDDFDIKFNTKSVKIPIASITGSVVVRVSKQATAGITYIYSLDWTVEPVLKSYVVLNTEGI